MDGRTDHRGPAVSVLGGVYVQQIHKNMEKFVSVFTCLCVCALVHVCVFVDFKTISVLFKLLFLCVCVVQFVGGEPHTVGPSQASVSLI